MIWIFPALAGLLIVYFAMRSSRFQRFAEPTLSILVAFGLLSAFFVWIREDNSATTRNEPPPFSRVQPVIPPEDIVLERLTFARNRPDTSYRVTGTVLNKSDFNINYFRLAVTLEDCPANTCKSVGDDTALILARLAPGQSQNFETFFTFPSPFGVEPSAPKWSYRITEVNGRAP
jgi:hypothetical protein